MLGRLTAGVGALITLAALLIGIPVALVALGGNPIPDDLSAFLRPDLGGELFIGTFLPIIGWIAWASFAFTFLCELPAQLRGTRAPSLPAVLKPQQALARTLLAAVALMMLGTSTAQAAVAAPAEAAIEQTTHATTLEETIESVTPTQEADESTAAPADLPTVTAAPGDTLWGLAEKHLGDGHRYTEIADLNRGVMQADGGALDDSGWITTGWTITLPNDANLEPTPPATVTVDEGDTLEEIAQETLGDANRYDEIAAANQISNPDLINAGDQLTIPHSTASSISAPAQDETPEADPEETPPAAPTHKEFGAPAISEAAPAAPATAAPEMAEQAEDAAGEADLDEVFSPATIGGVGAIMAAGILGVLGARRFQQRRRRKPGQRIAMPSEEISTMELELRAVEDPMQMDDVDRALRYLAAWAQDSDNTLPRLFALRLAPDEIALYLDQPHELPDPFVPVTDDRTAWTINPRNIDDLDRTPNAPYPALVTLGHDANNGHILVDLEQIGALNVIGSDQNTHSAVTALAVELTTSQWADDLQVTLVGLADGLPTALDTGRIRHVDDIDTLLRNLRGQARATRDTLQSLGVSTIEEARGLDPDAEAWVPEIVILGHELTEPHKSELAELVTQLPRLGVAAVARGHLAGEWSFKLLSNRTAELEMPGGLGSMPITPQMLTDDEYQRILELINVADQPASTEWIPDSNDQRLLQLDTTEDAIQTAEAEAPTEAASAETDRESTLVSSDEALPADWTKELEGLLTRATQEAAQKKPAAVKPRRIDEPLDEEAIAILDKLNHGPWVKLLGAVELKNPRGTEPTTKQGSAAGRATELAAFLALNRGASRDSVHAAMWPGKPASGKSSSNQRGRLTSQLRKWLGNDDNGDLYLPMIGADGYLLSEQVTTDAAIFYELVGSNPTKATTARLKAAIDLVTGQPISGVRQRFYAWADSARQELIAAVGDACHELVARCIDAGDTATARTVAALAREVDPSIETYWRDALVASEAAGDLDDALRIAAQLEQLLDDIDPDYEPEPETQAIIDRVREKVAQ